MPIPKHSLRLRVLPGVFAYARVDPSAPAPGWAEDEDFSVCLRTRTERCVVCPFAKVPQGVTKEGPWKIIGVDATLDFNQIGIIASLALPLAEAGVSIAPIASFDTDYILIRDVDLSKAKKVLVEAGHSFA